MDERVPHQEAQSLCDTVDWLTNLFKFYVKQLTFKIKFSDVVNIVHIMNHLKLELEKKSRFSVIINQKKIFS